MVLVHQICHKTCIKKSWYKGGIKIGKSVIQDNDKILIEDKATYFKSSREIKQCEIYLTDKRIIAYNKPPSFFKSIKDLFKNPDVVLEVPLCSINSIRDGQLYQRNIMIFKTVDGTEYPLHFELPGQKWKKSVIDAVSNSEPDITVKEVGDYIKFKRQQPR